MFFLFFSLFEKHASLPRQFAAVFFFFLIAVFVSAQYYDGVFFSEEVRAFRFFFLETNTIAAFFLFINCFVVGFFSRFC